MMINVKNNELSGVTSDLIESAAWTIWGHLLGEMFRKWLTEAVCIEQKKKDPELFVRTLNVSINDEDLKSETNRVLGWAIKSARDRQKDVVCDEYHLLNSKICQEKDLNDEHVATKYDVTTMLRNIGVDGGLSLVTEEFLSWGMKAMRNITNN